MFNLGDKYQEGSLLLVPHRFAMQATERYKLKLINAVTWVKLNPTPRQFRRRLVSSTEPFFHFAKSDNYYYIDAFNQSGRLAHDKKSSKSEGIGKGYFALIDQSELTPEQKHSARLALMDAIQEAKMGKIAGFRMKIRGIHSEPFGGQAGGRQIQLEKNGFTMIRIHGNPLKKRCD